MVAYKTLVSMLERYQKFKLRLQPKSVFQTTMFDKTIIWIIKST